MRARGDRGRHAGLHGLEHQVVREGVAAQHLCGLEFVQRIGELHRRGAQYLLGQLDLEVHPGNAGQPRQRQRGRRELAQAPLDQPADRQGPGQVLHIGKPIQRAIDPGLLERLEHEQRVAAGAL